MSVLQRLRRFVAVKEDENGRTADRWSSPDILPVLPQNRTFDSKAYASYWVSGAVSASFWSLASSGISNGLTPGEAIGAMVVGAVMVALVAQACGAPGLKYHLGFPMMSRATFGMYGSYLVVLVKCFTTFIYCGVQSYWGGLAVHVILASIFPSYHNMRNTLPESANIDTTDIVGLIIYWVVFVAVLMIPIPKLRYFFMVAFAGVVTTILGMFIWAMVANHGAGNLISPTISLTKLERAFAFMQVICSLGGSLTGTSVRFSDWSRYAKTPRSPLLGIWLVGPVGLVLTGMFGVFVTSACQEMYGTVLWQPISLLLHIQAVDYSPAVRAGTFFAGVGWFMSQLAVNVSLNAVSAGMDLASLAPQYLNARRGSMCLAIIGLVVCPWNYVNSASGFTTVLSSFGLFISPLMGMYIADYWIIRKTKWKVPDLYVGNKTSVYWYICGVHWKAIVVWLGMIWVSMPGFVMAVSGMDFGVVWKRIFEISFLVGIFGGFIFYTLLCVVLPVDHAGIHEDYEDIAGITVLDGKEPETSSSVDEKIAAKREVELC